MASQDVFSEEKKPSTKPNEANKVLSPTHTHTPNPGVEGKKKEMWFLDIKSKLKVATKWLYCNLLNFDETLINSSEEEEKKL